MLLDRWYNWGLSETTLLISSSQSELKSPRKFLLLDFFFSFLYFLFSLLFVFTLTLLLTSNWLFLYGERHGISSRSVFRVPCEPEKILLWTVSSLLVFATPFEDLENKNSFNASKNLSFSFTVAHEFFSPTREVFWYFWVSHKQCPWKFSKL